ncbi:RBBP9/YdeN family alpha/beta hydrolase [Zoogloea sp.]|uniref:RBBP9/YdeN family alpha/beta hydrolase n=1 Tax=Zoogloea sp. TaxID=49181 RepID=UPI0035B412FF
MEHSVLIVPGFHGSEEAHWQSWLEGQLANARRIEGVDWEQPALLPWVRQILLTIDEAPGTVWIVAHSFGCLASVFAARDRLHRLGGLMLVAPADPERFSPLGVRNNNDHPEEDSLSGWLPHEPLGIPTLVVASTNDPKVKLSTSAYWASAWGSHFEPLINAGHINTEAGFGPWPKGLQLLRQLQASHLGASCETRDTSPGGKSRARIPLARWNPCTPQ